MPFIHTSTNITITPEKELLLKEKLGKAITNIPGKNENWLMLRFDDNCHMYFKGNGEKPLAFVEIKVYGSVTASAFDKMTAAITDLISEELNIDPERIYVKYEEVEHWGYNGANF